MMKKYYRQYFFGFLIVYLCIFSGTPVQGKPIGPKTLFVSGIEAGTRDAKWESLLIAYGMVRLIEEQLFDTGYFVPVENRLEIQEQVNQLIESAWNFSDDTIDTSKRVSLESEIKSDVVVSGIVKKIRSKRKKAFLGPLSKAEVTIFFSIELLLKEHGKVICSGQGTGKGITNQQAAFFQIRKDTICFDDTSVGKAVHEAVTKAVGNMVREYENQY